MSIGAEIKRLRKERGYTQEELGKILGVQKSAVQKYEKGTIKNYKPEIISKLCQAFDVSPAVFFDSMIDTDKLSREVKLLEELSIVFGGQAVDLLESFQRLNIQGKEKLRSYAKDLAEIKKYIN
jgi:transcriptional regulator with XRE-family HTH domain